MRPTPRLLETYEEARLLLEAKGWGIAKAADHLSELPGMARFNISQTKLSKKTTPGTNNAIEPEVAAAVEGMETRIGYERKTEIVTAGLRAAHADRPAVEEWRPTAGQRVFRFLRKLGRASWRRPIIISAGSGALVACLVLLVVAPLLAGATQPGPLVFIVADAGPDGSPVRFDPRSLMAMPASIGEQPWDQPIPVKTLPGQKVAPCNAALGEEAINGNCWAWMASVKPPCGLLYRHGDKCYRPIAAEPKKPTP